MYSKNGYGRTTIDSDRLFQVLSKSKPSTCDTSDFAEKNYLNDLYAK
jgi:hypothetical protein